MTGLSENGAGPRHPLERLLAPVEPIAVSDPSWAPARDTPTEALVHCRVGFGQPTWVRTGDWRLYARLDSASDDADADEAIASFVAEAPHCQRLSGAGTAASWSRSGSPRPTRPTCASAGPGAQRRSACRRGTLDAFYRVKRAIPRRAQLAAPPRADPLAGAARVPRVALRRLGGPPAEASRPRRPGCAEARELRFRWFWPRRAARRRDPHPRRRERARACAGRRDRRPGGGAGLRSSFNIVADWYPIDRGDRRGADRTRLRDRRPRRVPRPLDVRLPREVRGASARAGARRCPSLGAVGFRSPATHRVNSTGLPSCRWPTTARPALGPLRAPARRLLLALAVLHRATSSSCPTRCPRTTRCSRCCATARRAVDRPARAPGRAGGLVQCLSHPDPGYLGDATRRLYAEFLDAVAARDTLWTALPREVAAWWRERDAAYGEPALEETGIASIDDSGAGPPPARRQTRRAGPGSARARRRATLMI